MILRNLFLSTLTLAACLEAQPAAAARKAPAKPPAAPAATSPPPKGYLNKATMAAWVRHFRLYPAPVNLVVSDPMPSDVPGLLEISVSATMGAASEQSRYFVTRDGSKLIEGRSYDSTQNPFKRELDKLKTDFQPSMGTAGAPVVIVVFSDFQCGYCKKEAEILRTELLKAFPTQVRLYFKDFPLESIHPWAKPAAIGGRCVFRQKATAFWEYHDAIFAAQDKITAENLRGRITEFAKTKELDTAQLEACLSSKSAEAEVDKSAGEARELGVQSTPTLYVNGRSIPGSVAWDNLKQIIEFEIGYQATAKNAGEQCCTLSTPSLLSPKPNPILPK